MAGGQARARDIPIPLPTSGVFVEAKTGKTSPIFASELHNLVTDGIALEVRRAYELGEEDDLAMQRVPYAFGATPRYIELRAEQAECAGATFARQFDGSAMVAYISSQAMMVDGLDLPVRYDGTIFATALFTTTTGALVQEFDGCIAHHDRLYFWKSNGTLEFYYGDVGAVMGALVQFPLDRLGNITGNMLAAISVTIDAGENNNDALAIYTTTGQIVVYEGLNPGDPNDWNLSVRMQVAPPVSRFAFTRVGGDVWVLTARGLISLRDTLSQGSLALVNTLGRPVADEIRDLVDRPQVFDVPSGTFLPNEWQLHTSADGSSVIVNFFAKDLQRQFIWNVESKGWQTGNYPARHWHNLVLSTDFTTDGGRIGALQSEEDGTEAITAWWYTGWFTFNGEATVAYVKPTIIARGELTVKVAVLRDHMDSAADIAQVQQIVTLSPEGAANVSGKLSLNDEIPCGITGTSFQLRIEVTATWAQIVDMAVGLE